MRVLLTVPNTHNDIRDGLGYLSPPLGLGYIASYIRKFGNHQVRIHDGLLHHSSCENIKRHLETFRPEVVGISGQATPSVYDVYRTAKLIKAFNPEILVVVGGAHVSFQDIQTLRACQAIDVVVRGEGERTMNELLHAYGKDRNLTNVRGITYRNKERLVQNPNMPLIENLDSIPLPAYDLLHLPDYFHNGVRFTTMVTSRGCPYGCTFCSSSRITGKRWRGRSAENVINEIKLLLHKYGVREIEFIDDLFTYNIDRVWQICKSLNEENINIGWTCSTRVNILAKHPEIAEWLHSAGCHSVYMGVESGSQRILNAMRKGITIEQVKRAVRIAKDAGLQLILSFMIGYPGETEADIEKTIDLACRLDPDFAQFTVCTPYPGTPLYEQAKKKGMLHAKSWSDFSVLGAVMDIPGITAQRIRQLMHKAYRKFYMRPSFLWKQLKLANIDFFKTIWRVLTKFVTRL